MSNLTRTISEALARQVRDYVRDHFTAGSIDALNELEEFVRVKVSAVARAERLRLPALR